MMTSNVVERLVDNTTFLELAHTNLIVGDKGCGKHTFVQKLSEKFGIRYIDLTDDITFESLSDIDLSSELLFCLFDGNRLTTKEQNAILKFIEEPKATVYVFIVVDNINRVLPTIVGRCIIHKFPIYTDEELAPFSSDEVVLKIFRTPGMIKAAEQFDINSMIDYINKMIDFSSQANWSNFLSIKGKLGKQFPDIDKNLYIFFQIFDYVLIDRMKANRVTGSFTAVYECVAKYRQKMTLPKISTDDMFSRFLIEFKEINNGH